MTNPRYDRTQVRTPDWSRVTRAAAPRIAGVVPLLEEPVANANALLNKNIATLSRAGSGKGNPILAGLGVRAQIGLGLNDRLLGIYLFQDPNERGANLVSQAAAAGQFATFDFLAGSGQTVAGDAETGALRNFFRYVTEAGPVEREFWVKNYDADIVVANGLAVLDPATLEPVEIPLSIVDAGRDWIDVPVDFFLSWNDEFQVLARGTSQQTEAGFLKPYGGALFVSFFDLDPGTEGIGVEVNPLTRVAIATQRTIQIENAEGTKDIVARFRSDSESSFLVDVPIRFVVSAAASEICEPPFTEPCSVAYLKHETELPADCPDVASVPGEQVVAGTEGDELAIDLLVLTVHGTTVTPSPKLRVSKWKWVENSKALIGADLEEVGSPEDYLPLVGTGTSPVESPPYEDPKRLTIAFSVLQLQTDLVSFLTVCVLDGEHVSSPIPVPGPRAREVQFMPINPGGRGDGGGELCLY